MVSPASTASPHAPYTRVKQHLKDGLASGRWAPGGLMPSEAELVAHFGVSRMTVSRALRELQAEGLVQRVQGLGTFAAKLHAVSSRLTIRDIAEEITSRGHRHHAQVHLQRAQAAPPALAAQLGVAPGALVFHTFITHFENSLALQCEDRYVNPACAPDYLACDFSQTTPTQHLFAATDLWRAQYSISAEQATVDEARHLGLALDAPCLVVVRRTFTRTAAITIARLVQPGQRYTLHGEFAP